MTSQRTRDRLIQRLRQQGVDDERVLAVIRDTPRHLFVDEALASRAYEDSALPIGFGQTISQPYIVARMTQAIMENNRPRKVLEVGSGSGYQTAVLAQLVEQVFSVERIDGLLRIAERRMRELGLHNVRFRRNDGSWGWQHHAPYDAILVTAAPLDIPSDLLQQLADGGRMVIPVGAAGTQKLMLLTREGQQVTQQLLENVSFVPLVTGQ